MNRSTWGYYQRTKMSTRAVGRVVVADAVGKIHLKSRVTYGKRRIQAALLEEYEMIVNLKLVGAVMRERGLAGLPRMRRSKPDLLGVFTPGIAEAVPCAGLSVAVVEFLEHGEGLLAVGECLLVFAEEGVVPPDRVEGAGLAVPGAR